MTTDNKKTAKHSDSPSKSNTSSSKKGIAISIVAIVAVIVAAVVGVIYWRDRQSPQKIVTDSIVNTIRSDGIVADGTVSLNSSFMDTRLKVDNLVMNDNAIQANLKFNVDGENGKSKKQVSMDVISTNSGDLYVKISDIEAISELMKNKFTAPQLDTSVMGDASMSANKNQDKYKSVLSKISNQWIKLPSDGLVSYTDSLNDFRRCFVGAGSNDSDTDAVVEAYRGNQFLLSGQKIDNDGMSSGYNITFSRNKYDSFKDNLNNKQYENIFYCLGDNKFFASLSESDVDKNKEDTPKLSIWIDNISHTISRVKTDSDSSLLNVDLKIRYKKQDIQVPDNAKSIQDIMSMIDPGMAKLFD